MPPIYIIEQGAKLRIRNQCLVIEKENGGKIDIAYQTPLGTISQIVIFGNVGLTTPAIAAFLEREIDVVFLNIHGIYRGRLISGITPHVSLRRAQYASLADEDFVRRMSICLIRAKVRHQRALLRRHNREIQNETIQTSIVDMTKSETLLENKISMNGLRGAEGRAAAAYFSGYRQLFPPEWNFTLRKKHPSPDPVNAMLSFGYTLLSQIAVSSVQITGLDPYAGFLHSEAYNRPSLGLDVMEEFRPVVDGVVLWCCRGGMITPSDFETAATQNQCTMISSARKKFIAAFEERMNGQFTHPLSGTKISMRQCITEQARQVAACCLKAPADPQFTSMGFR